MSYTAQQRRDWRRELRERRELVKRLAEEAKQIGGIMTEPEGEHPILWVKDAKGIWRSV